MKTNDEKTKYCLDILGSNRGAFVMDEDLIQYMRELPKDKLEIIDAFEKYMGFLESLEKKGA